MKAIVCTKYGPPDVLEFKEVEKPEPKNNELLIKVHASTVTPMDWRFRQGKNIIARMMAGPIKPKNSVLGIELVGGGYQVLRRRSKESLSKETDREYFQKSHMIICNYKDPL
jgi:hypothetical protein